MIIYSYKMHMEKQMCNQLNIAWNQILFYIQKGKFHVEMTNTTPKGSDTISADDGYVVSEVLTWKNVENFHQVMLVIVQIREFSSSYISLLFSTIESKYF